MILDNLPVSPRDAAATCSTRAALSVRSVFSLLLAFIGLFGMAMPAHALDMDAMLGFGPNPKMIARYRYGDWTPLAVYLTGTGMRGVGQLQVSVRMGDRSTLYTRPISLRDGAMNEVETFAIMLRDSDISRFARNSSTPEINVQLVVEGRKVAEKKVVLGGLVSGDTFNVLALTNDTSGLNFLARKKMGLVHRHINPASVGGGGFNNGGGRVVVNGKVVNPMATATILYQDRRALPSMPQGYSMVDAVALGDLPLDNLTDDQMDALQGYVRQGGLLIVSGGNAARLKSNFFADLLPIIPSSDTTVSSFPALATRYREPIDATPGSKFALTTGQMKPGAVSLLDNPGGSGIPLVSMMPYGAGRVVFTAFDFQDPAIRSWKAAPSLWRDLLRCGNEAVSARDILADNAHGGMYYGGGNSVSQLEDALAGKQATNTPAFSTVAGFLGAYIFLLVPVSYLILKKLDRREWAWITTPILVLGFTILSYGIATAIKGGLLTVNRVVVLETGANSDQAAGYGQMTLYSPRRAAYDIAFGPADDPNNPYRSFAPDEVFAGGAGLGTELKIDNAKTATIREAQVKLWDKRSFDVPVSTPLGGAVEATTQMLDAQNARVTVRNQTRFTLRNCALVNSDISVGIGDLAPGATVQKTVVWSVKEANNLRVPTLTSPADNVLEGTPRDDTPEVTRLKMRSALANVMASGVQNNGYYWNGSDDDNNSYGKATNALVGWLDTPILDVNVDGRKASGEEIGLLVVHLPAPNGARPRVAKAANPFADTPTLNLEDEQPLGGGFKKGVFK